MLAAKLTAVPGSSDYFLGGVVTYSNESKENILTVPKEHIEAHGAVSEEVAIDMAIGVRELFDSTLSLSITGIAGPGGGTENKPVGLVWIGLSSNEHTIAKQFIFNGDRNNIRESSARAALEMLSEQVEFFESSV